MPRGGSPAVASEATRAFSRVDEFLAGWKPLTPWGKDAKEAKIVFADPKAIGESLDLAEAWAAFAGRLESAGRGAALDRTAWHLGRMPRLPEPLERSDAGLDPVELFAVRKFIANYRKLSVLIDEVARSDFGFVEPPAAVTAVFAALGEEGESFHVADACDVRLPPLRARLAELDRFLKRAKEGREAAIREAIGVDFGGREFVVTERWPLPGASDSEASPQAEGLDELVEVEAWDGHAHVLRPRPGREELVLSDERVKLLAEERLVEAEVSLAMSRAVAQGASELRSCAAAVARLDGARSRWLLTRGAGFVRPGFVEGESLSIRRGRLAPLESECAKKGMRYAPLDLELDERVAFIYGSNMGGKTVVLETLLFLQLLAQSGFHVPAERFESPVFPFIAFIGEGSAALGDSESATGGLSGFGREIAALVEAMERSGSGGLLAFDEFARTTNSGEAEAILSALARRLAEREGLKSLFATHFRGVERARGLRRFRMRGLDREAARRLESGEGGQAGAADEESRGRSTAAKAVEMLNRLMRYELVEDEGGDGGSDALTVAALLGLDRRVVDEAMALYAGRFAGPTREPKPPRQGNDAGVKA